MDPGLGLAWIGYGHAFAAQDERDQVQDRGEGVH